MPAPMTANVKDVKDDLLAQLNGEVSLPPLIDAAPLPSASRESELTVASAPALSPVAAADASHATRVGGKGYRVTVKGEYFAESPTGRGKILKPYEAEFTLPNLDAALSVIKNKLLDASLKKKYADFVSVRTNKIVDARPLSPEMPASRNLQYMTREDLVAHILSIRAPIDAAVYADVTHLRDAIIDYTQTPDGFEKREAAKQAERLGDAELRALNPDLEVE